MARVDKTRPADRAFADARLDGARAFLQQAEMSLALVDGTGRNAAVLSSAVLAGIAACDAACALALGKVSAGVHDQAANVLQEVSGSAKAVSDFSRLLNIKTASQYTAKSMAELSLSTF